MVSLKGKERPCRMTVGRNTEKRQALYQRIDFWIRPILERFGETEWGKGQCVVDLKTAEISGIEEERGWIVRKLAEKAHYQIGVDTSGGGKNVSRFLIKTGGRTVFSKDLTEEGLKEALDEAIGFGPTHLAPPGKMGR